MNLTTEQVIEVEKHLEEHKGKVYVFVPIGVRRNTDYEPELYLAWLRNQYPDITFKYTCSMYSYSMDAKVSSYLQIKWQFRNTSKAIICHNLISLKHEIVPLRKIKQTVMRFRQAQKEMNKLRI